MIKPTLLTARTEFASALNQICTERGITPESVLETIRQAILAAYRKDFGIKEDKDYEVEVDSGTGAAKVFEMDKVEEETEEKKVSTSAKATADKSEVPEEKKEKEKVVPVKNRQEVTPPGFGRIAAQTAKQVILQKIREAEKSAIIDEFSQKIDELVNAMVLRFDGQDIICDIGRGQGRLPVSEQIRNEDYRLNKRLTLYILAIQETPKGKQIILSRSTPKLVAKLFKREVPEVNSKAVEIKIIAREPGGRSKVAVASTQPGVDPVGSCVGQRGVRVQAVIDELNGEKIDIIQYSADPIKFITGALSPAENISIKINEKKKEAVVTVPETQLSLAIGRDGQNVRLAAKLTGYKIDIRGPASAKATAGKPKIKKVEKVDKSRLKVEKKVKAKKVKTIKKKEK